MVRGGKSLECASKLVLLKTLASYFCGKQYDEIALSTSYCIVERELRFLVQVIFKEILENNKIVELMDRRSTFLRHFHQF